MERALRNCDGLDGILALACKTVVDYFLLERIFKFNIHGMRECNLPATDPDLGMFFRTLMGIYDTLFIYIFS